VGLLSIVSLNGGKTLTVWRIGCGSGSSRTTSLRRFEAIERVRAVQFGAVLGWEVHVGENICLGLVHQGGER
jgi:hypothetical protein